MRRAHRRPARAVAAISLVLAAIAGLVATPGANADPNTPTILFGVRPGIRGSQTQQQVVLDLEGRAGRTLPGIRVFDLWDSAFPGTYETWLRDTGHTVFLSVKSSRLSGGVILWRDIANSQPGSALYQQIVGWANKLKAFGAHLYFTFNHEPEAAASDSMGTPAEFIAAWRKVIGVLRQENVTNATYVFITTGYAYRVTDGRRADLWYPGDAWVDAIGEDDYNWSNCRPGVNTPWRSLEFIADPLRTWAEDHPGKELMITEWASHEDPAVAGRKANWITEARALFKEPGWERFTVMLYYHESHKPTCPFWLDSSASSMNAWVAMANDPYYARGDVPTVPDTEAPTPPGRPEGASQSPGSIDLSWEASDDDLASLLTYRIYRDGGTSPVGTVSSSSTTTVSFRDAGLGADTTHTYHVTASDGVNVSDPGIESEPITVMPAPPYLFADGFDAGFASWTTATGLTLDATTGGTAPPSARSQVSGARAWASELLGSTTPSICMSERVSLTSIGANTVSLLRIRTATDAPLARVFLNRSRVLALRADVTGAVLATTTTLPIGGWNTVELCGDIAGGGSLSLYLNGALIAGPWTQSLGSTPFGRVMLGDSEPKTVTVNYDDVVVDTMPG